MEQIWVKTGKEEGFENYEAVEFPEGSDYWMDIPGSELMFMPVDVVSYSRDTRGKLSKLFSRKLPINSFGQVVTMSQQFTEKGPYETIYCTERRGGRLVASRDGKQVHLEEVRRRFSNAASVEQLGLGAIVYQENSPRYQTKTMQKRMGKSIESVTTVMGKPIEGKDAEKSPLSPIMRAALQDYGNIVYESGPSDATRLIVCLKNLHGSYGDRFILSACGPQVVQRYDDHHRKQAEVMRKLWRAAGSVPVSFFFETEAKRFKDLSPSEQASRAQIFALAEVFSASPEHEEAVAKAFREDFSEVLAKSGYKPEEYDQLFRQTLPACIISHECLSQGRSDALFGDGRAGDEMYMTGIDTLQKRISEISDYAGMSGAAGDEATLCTRKDECVFGDPQRVLVQGMATLPPHSVGILLYGAAHFSSGTNCGDDIISVKRLEEYMSLLPDTYVVVIEEGNYVKLWKDYNAQYDGVRNTKDATIIKTFLDIHKLMFDATTSFYLSAAEWWKKRSSSENWKSACSELPVCAKLILDLQKLISLNSQLISMNAQLQEIKGVMGGNGGSAKTPTKAVAHAQVPIIDMSKLPKTKDCPSYTKGGLRAGRPKR